MTLSTNIATAISLVIMAAAIALSQDKVIAHESSCSDGTCSAGTDYAFPSFEDILPLEVDQLAKVRELDIPSDIFSDPNNLKALFRKWNTPLVVRKHPDVVKAYDHVCNAEQFVKKVPYLNGVKVNRRGKPLFVYADEGRLYGKVGLVEAYEKKYKYDLLLKVSSKSLFDSLDGNGEFKNPWYFSHYMNNTNDFKGLEKEIWPLEVFSMDDVKSWRNIWIGKPGIVAGIHFDQSYNVFSQICGKKRFLVLPTQAWKGLHLFPYYHPRERQSQLENEYGMFIELNNFFHKYRDQIQIADLNPGDVLYLPPYYFHRVVSMESDSLSISVNTWSTSEEERRSNVFGEYDVPKLVRNHPGENVGASFVHFIRTLVKESVEHADKAKRIYDDNIEPPKVIIPQAVAARFISEMVTERFLTKSVKNDLLCSTSPDVDDWEPSKCPKAIFGANATLESSNDFKFVKSEAVKLVGDYFKFLDKFEKDKNKKENSKEKHQHLLHQIAIEEIHLMDFIERSVAFLIGEESCCIFLRCLGGVIG